MREILCFGDSNTYGLIPGTKERYKENIRWTGILQQKLKEQDCRIVEEGLCGRTTVFEDELRKNRKGSDLLPVLLESHAPIDQVVLMLGTNDCKSYYHASAEVIGLGVEKLIGQIRQAGEHIKILLVSPSSERRGTGPQQELYCGGADQWKKYGNRNMIRSLMNSQWRHPDS